nr:MAG: ORF1 [TTV-like mini virus]
MPFYYRRRRYFWPRANWKRKQRFRRRRFGLWRPRQTFRRRFHRRTTVRKYRLRHRKKRKLHIQQWQPRTIHKCKIKGDIILFLCGKKKIAHDYTMYKESMTPVGEASGGGWSIQQFTLEALYTEYQKLRCFWTKSNLGLPFVRYTGCTFKFFKSKHTDYIVTWCICPPFGVNLEMFLNTQPQRQLFERHRIIVPQLNRNTRKRYKKIKLKPPSFMRTKWYFQQDFCKQPLVLITTTAASLTQPYCPDDQISNNITLISLNLSVFQNPNFETWTDNWGYHPKHLGTRPMYLLGALPHVDEPPTKFSQVIPLTMTNKWSEGYKGTSITFENFKKSENWGNPFSLPFVDPDTTIYYTDHMPTSESDMNTTKTFTAIDSLFWECRYNPDKDTGQGNVVYLKPNNANATGSILDPPTKPEHILKGYPLWLVFWGFHDYILKTSTAQHMDQSYYFVVKTNFITPKRDGYLFLDKYFWQPNRDTLTQTDRLKWHPKTEMQEEIEFYFAQAGPYAPKINESQCIQANAQYTFYMKWGGCPPPMETIISPCVQDKFPIPDPQLQRLTIQDPNTQKETFLYEWDERRHTITEPCAKRIKKDSIPDKYVTGLSLLDLPNKAPQKESDQETTSEEEEPPLLHQQLRQLRHRQRKLQKQLLQLTKLN